MVDLLISVIVTVVYVVSAVNIGLLFFYILDVCKIRVFKEEHIVAEMTISFLFGLAFLSNAWLLIGLFFNLNIYTTASLILLSVLITFLVWNKYLYLFIWLTRVFKKALALGLAWKMLLAIITLQVVLFGIASAILPPSGDAEAFYMVWPKIISYTGTIIPQPNYYSFSQIGISGELHFASLITIGSPNSATFLVWFISLSVMSCLTLICSQLRIGMYGKIVALIIVVTSTAFTTIISGGNVNLFAAAYALAAYYWAIMFIIKGQKRELVLCGLFAGLAVVAKFSYLIVLLPSIGLIIILKYLYEKVSIKLTLVKVINSGIIISMAFCLILIPHFLKNYMLFSEPFAPFLFLSNQESLGWVNQVWYAPAITRHIVLTYPIALSFGIYPMQGGNISPLVIIFLPLLFFAISRKHSISMDNLNLYIGLIGVLSLILWVAIQPSILAPRYILAALFLLVFPVVKGIDVLFGHYKMKLYKVVVIAILFWSLLLMSPHNSFSSLRALASVVMHDKEINTSYYDSCTYINQVFDNNSSERLYLAGYYSFNLMPEILVNLPNPDENSVISKGKELDERIDLMAELGFTYLMVQKASHGSNFSLTTSENETALQNIEKVFEDDYTFIYRLRRNN